MTASLREADPQAEMIAVGPIFVNRLRFLPPQATCYAAASELPMKQDFNPDVFCGNSRANRFTFRLNCAI
jgi:hypothetical protein